MTKTRRTFPESLKREAVEQVLAGTPLRHVAQAFDIIESLLGKWKRQFQDAGPDAFPGRGKQSGEAAELKRLRDELARVTMERDVLKNRPWGYPAPSRSPETPSLSYTEVAVASGRLLFGGLSPLKNMVQG
ncbi:transposase, partial [Vogesella indigofera]|uniref:transposase n=1 Tax=Vogesella indigofera TaxID=45465 RepID=UPI00234C3EE7